MSLQVALVIINRHSINHRKIIGGGQGPPPPRSLSYHIMTSYRVSMTEQTMAKCNLFVKMTEFVSNNWQHGPSISQLYDLNLIFCQSNIPMSSCTEHKLHTSAMYKARELQAAKLRQPIHLTPSQDCKGFYYTADTDVCILYI